MGEGPADAKAVFVGEAPGAVEGVYTRPFVGRAGQLMRVVLVGKHRCSKVFITNILACRPPKNRDPSIKEISNCMERLEQLLSILKPQLVITVGRVAETWCEHLSSQYNLLFVYHPAYLLRNGITVSTNLQQLNYKTLDKRVVSALKGYQRLRDTLDELK